MSWYARLLKYLARGGFEILFLASLVFPLGANASSPFQAEPTNHEAVHVVQTHGKR